MKVLVDVNNSDFKLLYYFVEKNLWLFVKLYYIKLMYLSKIDRIYFWIGIFIDIFLFD